MEGCAKVGKVSPEVASILWNQMVEFSSYAFNKSHSVCYSYLSYCCAYLKANYPLEFFVSLLSSRSLDGNKWEKAGEYIHEIKSRDIEVRGPNINTSKAIFTIDNDRIYWGFQAIKGIGASTGNAIEACRGSTKFKDIWDFLERVDRSSVNTGNFRALALAGAFDCLGSVKS
jgi:DNA polymerase-3 subunit alpha